jgi:hypothetical protein
VLELDPGRQRRATAEAVEQNSGVIETGPARDFVYRMEPSLAPVLVLVQCSLGTPYSEVTLVAPFWENTHPAKLLSFPMAAAYTEACRAARAGAIPTAPATEQAAATASKDLRLFSIRFSLPAPLAPVVQ